MLGDEFTVGKFDVTEHETILGSLDHSRTIVMPIFGNYAFKDSAFQLQVQPQKILIHYRDGDILPDNLLSISRTAAPSQCSEEDCSLSVFFQ